jgi:hypothetical protein
MQAWSSGGLGAFGTALGVGAGVGLGLPQLDAEPPVEGFLLGVGLGLAQLIGGKGGID